MTFSRAFLLSLLVGAAADLRAVTQDVVVTGQVTVVQSMRLHIVNDRGTRHAVIGETDGLHDGDLVVERCVRIHDEGWTSLLLSSFDKVGHAPPPPPRDVTLEGLLRDRPFLECVRFRCFVEDFAQDETGGDILMTVRSGNVRLQSVILSDNFIKSNNVERLLDAPIELTGTYFEGLPSSRPYRGPIFIPRLSDGIRLVAGPAPDPFDEPGIAVDEATAPADLIALGRRTVAGTVLAHWGDSFILQSDLRGRYPLHRVTLAYGLKPPAVGAQVQVVGRLATDLYLINFTAARYRPWTGEPLAVPPVAAVRQDLHLWQRGRKNGKIVYCTDALGQVVQVRGTLTAPKDPRPDDPRLVLVVDGVPVDVDATHCPEALAKLKPGSELAVTGICLFDIANWRPGDLQPPIRGHELVLRNADDIAVVSEPSWWTPARLACVIAGLFALLVGSLVWNRILDRIVMRRSRELLRSQAARVSSELRIDERTRLAVELHDTLSQNLAGVACQVASAKGAVANDPCAAEQRLTVAERMLKSSRTELRMVLSDLRSEALEKPDLTTALRLVLDPVAKDADVSIRVNVPRHRLLDSTAHTVLCVIRELVGNAVRHGGAGSIRIAGALDPDKAMIFFSVREDGCGFDPSACQGPAEGHFGLDGIRNRVSRLGGTFELESSPGNGSRAVIGIPLPGQPRPEARPK